MAQNDRPRGLSAQSNPAISKGTWQLRPREPTLRTWALLRATAQLATLDDSRRGTAIATMFKVALDTERVECTMQWPSADCALASPSQSYGRPPAK